MIRLRRNRRPSIGSADHLIQFASRIAEKYKFLREESWEYVTLIFLKGNAEAKEEQEQELQLIRLTLSHLKFYLQCRLGERPSVGNSKNYIGNLTQNIRCNLILLQSENPELASRIKKVFEKENVTATEVQTFFDAWDIRSVLEVPGDTEIENSKIPSLVIRKESLSIIPASLSKPFERMIIQIKKRSRIASARERFFAASLIQQKTYLMSLGKQQEELELLRFLPSKVFERWGKYEGRTGFLDGWRNLSTTEKKEVQTIMAGYFRTEFTSHHTARQESQSMWTKESIQAVKFIHDFIKKEDILEEMHHINHFFSIMEKAAGVFSMQTGYQIPASSFLNSWTTLDMDIQRGIFKEVLRTQQTKNIDDAVYAEKPLILNWKTRQDTNEKHTSNAPDRERINIELECLKTTVTRQEHTVSTDRSYLEELHRELKAQKDIVEQLRADHAGKNSQAIGLAVMKELKSELHLEKLRYGIE